MFVSKGRIQNPDFDDIEDGVYHFSEASQPFSGLGAFIFIQLSAMVGNQTVQIVFGEINKVCAYRVRWTPQYGFRDWIKFSLL